MKQRTTVRKGVITITPLPSHRCLGPVSAALDRIVSQWSGHVPRPQASPISEAPAYRSQNKSLTDRYPASLYFSTAIHTRWLLYSHTLLRSDHTSPSRQPVQLLQLHDFEESFGDVWREFVMHSRLGLTVPERLKHYNRASALIGPVLMTTDKNIERIIGEASKRSCSPNNNLSRRS